MNIDAKIKEIRDGADSLEEDYPGHRREYVRMKAVGLAARAADHVVLELSDGSVEETEWLTAKVTEAFQAKQTNGVWRRLMIKDSAERKPC
jgi:hypothetical protein